VANPQDLTDQHFMRLALAQAHEALLAGEVPVGAVVVKNGQVVGNGRNSPVASSDPSAHAEISALRDAANRLSNYRLEGCTLYVTLEPCAMCAGGILHSRLDRVVFGASDPKTGSAGSVLNLFGYKQLNHQTSVQGGVLAQECSDLLRTFFDGRRQEARLIASPLRDDALRTPVDRFDQLPDYPWQAHYLQDLPALNGLRLHYLDEGPADAATVFVGLHSPNAWSYQYRHWLTVWQRAQCRVLLPDLIGFGKSDKPKRSSMHSFALHRQILLEWIERLDLRGIVLVVPWDHALLGLTLPMAAPERFKGVLAVASQHLDTLAPPAQEAPYADAGYRAALKVMPELLDQRCAGAQPEMLEKATAFWSLQAKASVLVSCPLEAVKGLAGPLHNAFLSHASGTLRSTTDKCMDTQAAAMEAALAAGAVAFFESSEGIA
jgi:tRNA(adenine34) deaminase